ncbi:YggS family pyridoxal phosphate-dependent enzyme [Luteimonas sp. 8-5]|uniref:YggS family pyridoxal phosphate-dependent enzyme n=1 Tax=Luteimonas sp. 8-5 TaxID=3039387 RepID=UPI0024362FD3|nr:YggS family pyridoxal phosphate-dependent enzyme [Luteimonas sp. 8-5]MDG6347682.1 YggS family pyridoxal phosphate-dependent enzyme [Luteimonas sp. 8-5]
MQNTPRDKLHALLQSLDNAARRSGRPAPRLLAVSKRHPVTAVAEMASAWRQERPGEVPAFGENYVQEARAKAEALAAAGGPPVEWHLVGHLQSNKAALAADLFDWVQSVDSVRLAAALGRHRDAGRSPMNVLLQVNIDAEPGKHGCAPADVPALAAAVAAQPALALRGLMAIPAPLPEPERRREAFARMRALFDSLRTQHAGVDTLSMGMSDDAELAIAEGATMVRVGTALFGPRN